MNSVASRSRSGQGLRQRRRRLTSKAPATKAAFKAEQELFRLRRELQRFDLENPESAPRREALPEVRRGGKVIDIERLRR